MKNLIVFLVCFMCLLFSAGCSQGATMDPANIITNFESDAQISVNNKNYRCKLFHTPEGINTIEFVDPQSIKGLTFSCQGGKYEVSLKDLSGEFSNHPLPEDAFVRKIVDALNSLSNKENLKFVSKKDDKAVFTCTSSNVKCEITVDNKGNITNISFKDDGIEVDLNYD